MSEFTAADRVMWQRFRVSRELLDRFNVKRVDDQEARDLGIRYAAAASLEGLWFPFHSLQDPSKRIGGSLRRDRPEDENGKPRNKWLSTYGDRRHLYFPRTAAEQLRNSATVVVLVESPKSVVTGAAWSERTGRSEFLFVGLGGCWGHRGRIGKTQNARGQRVDEVGVLPDLAACCSSGREVIVLLDANATTNPSVRAAERALVRTLLGYECRVRVVRLPASELVNGPDDFLAVAGDQALATVLDTARLAAEVVSMDAEAAIATTAQADAASKPSQVIYAAEVISEIEDRIEREAMISLLAKTVHRVIGKNTITELVVDLRDRHAQERAEQAQQVKDAMAPDVDSAQLLDDLAKFFSERAYLPDGAALLLAHYALNTWTFQAFDSVPYLLLESAVPRCGKSTLMRLTAAVSCRPRMSNSLTEATLFRLIHKESPTLCIDEAETINGKSDRAQFLQAIANEGYKAGSEVPRCQGDDYEVVWFKVFSPKIFAAIGGLSGALLDRCLVIHMERAPKGHKRQSCRMRVIRKAAEPLVKQLEAYAARKTEELRALYDAEPDQGYWSCIADRESELWGPLLIHAKLAGKKMEDKLLKVATKFSEQKEDIEASDWHIAQTADLLAAIQSRPGPNFTPGELLTALLKSEAWAKPLAEAKGRDEDSVKRNQAAKIGYFLRSFRLSGKPDSDGHKAYERQKAIDCMSIYVPPNLQDLQDLQNVDLQSVQVIDNKRNSEGTEDTEGFTEAKAEGIYGNIRASVNHDSSLFSEQERQDDNDADGFVEGEL